VNNLAVDLKISVSCLILETGDTISGRNLKQCLGYFLLTRSLKTTENCMKKIEEGAIM
jgi:hypothetical protein